MGFQVLDDLLNLIGDEGRLGKPTGNDIASEAYTLPVPATRRGPRRTVWRRDGDVASRSCALAPAGTRMPNILTTSSRPLHGSGRSSPACRPRSSRVAVPLRSTPPESPA
jgi:Polyprenyl synthetase